MAGEKIVAAYRANLKIAKLTLGSIPKILGLQAFLILVVVQLSAFAWGNDGHIYVNSVAVEKLPASMPDFLKTAPAHERIAYLGPEPDRWRGASEYALNNAQSPDHFIYLERIEGLGELPRGRYEFYKLLDQKRAATKTNSDDYLPENVGLQPYITMEVFERLKAAFREYRKLKNAGQPTEPVEQDIIFYAGWLGHYVADGAQPLHTTIQHDGWVGPNPRGFTTKAGFHWRFENDFVKPNIKAADFAGLVGPAHALADPFHDYLKYLRVSHGLVDRVYELEKAKGFAGRGSREALQFTEQRLATGSQMLLDLWYTAWMQSADLNSSTVY